MEVVLLSEEVRLLEKDPVWGQGDNTENLWWDTERGSWESHQRTERCSSGQKHKALTLKRTGWEHQLHAP